MKVLVIAEYVNQVIKAATLSTITAAKKLGQDIHVLVAGERCHEQAMAAAKIEGVTKVLVADAPCYAHQLAENISALVVKLATAYTHILAASTTFAKDFMPRVAAVLDVAQISDIIKIIAPDTFVRPIYAGNALATVQTIDPIKVMTIRATGFAAAGYQDNSAPIEKIDFEANHNISTFIRQELSVSIRPELTAARVIVSGGRGMQNSDNFKLLEQLADQLGAAIGASRAAVDAGFVPNDYQVGQTGKVVAPDLYIAVGISGAIQHLAGMKDSKVIVAINKDPDAPIFQIADYGLVGDLFVILPELIAELDKMR